MKVNGIDSNNTKSQKIQRPKVITVKKGETITSIAKRYGMSKTDFEKWCNITGTLQAGQKITLPTDTVPKGKGIYALARAYNMTLAEFSKLNGIKDPENYKAQEGEVFYVKPKPKETSTNSKQQKTAAETSTTRNSTNTKTATKNTTTQNKSTPIEAESKPTITTSTPKSDPIANNKVKWGSSYTPKELGEKIFELSGKHYGAVGKPNFDALIKEINPKNVAEVISEYTSNPQNKKKESLINTITSEIKSDKQARINAAMHIYDTLAKTKTVTPQKREEFLKELNAQFDKWIGMVNTEKLDKILQDLLAMPTKSSSRATNNIPSGSTKVIVPESKYPQTVSTLQKSAIKGAKEQAAKKFKEYCKANKIKYNEKLLDLTAFDKIPEVVIDKKGNIIPYVSELQKPTGKPNGKVIILNSGHGGYNRKTGAFDIGAYSFIKQSNGKYTPNIEYQKANQYVNEMANKLRAEGYSVVITQGEATSFAKTETLTNLINSLQKGTEANNHQYKATDIAFVSFHANSSNKILEPNDKSSVCFNPESASSNRLANLVNENLNNNPEIITSETSERVPGKNGVWVLTETSQTVPAILLETAYINGIKGAAALNSPKFRQQFIDNTLLGLNKYFGIK